MKFGSVAKSTQEQAVASWTYYLNQLRMERCLMAQMKQDDNLKSAMATLKDTFEVLDKCIIGRNRGGLRGMHGFVAEVSECGIGNARELIRGKLPIYIWINDNGAADLIKNGREIQQKFVAAGNNLSLQAVRQHLEKYPDFLKRGGKYQIPADYYEKIKYLLSLSEKEANKLATSDGTFSLKQWKMVREFFAKGDIKLKDIEGSILEYKDVQVGKVSETFAREEKNLRETDSKLREEIQQAAKPSLKQGLSVGVSSAAMEGGTSFVLAIVKKRKEGKSFGEFGGEDWKEILKTTGKGTVKGGIRGVSLYSLTNYTATPAAVANALCTAAFGIANQANMLRKGEISENEFALNSEVLCVDASVSALSSFMGQTFIPIPVLGAIIGNTVGTLLYQVSKDTLKKKHRQLIEYHLMEIRKTEARLEREYRKCVADLVKGLESYYKLLDKACSPDYDIALQGSVALARSIGVPSSELLKNTEEVDAYFLG